MQIAISRTSLSSTVVIPQLYPGINFSNPKDLLLFRFIIVLGIIPDMVYTPNGYVHANADMQLNPVQVITDWYPSAGTFSGLTQEIKLANGMFLDESEPWYYQSVLNLAEGSAIVLWRWLRGQGVGRCWGLGE